MHLIFNAINVAVSYAGMIMIPGWFLIGAFVVGVIGFIVLCIFFFKKNPVELQVSGYKGRQLVTKEGYITMAVCLCDRNATYDIADRIGLIDGIAPHGCFGGCGVFFVIRDAAQCYKC